MSRRDPSSSAHSLRMLIRRGELARVAREEPNDDPSRREPDELFASIDEEPAADCDSLGNDLAPGAAPQTDD